MKLYFRVSTKIYFESASDAYGNTPYECSKELNAILKTLENETNKLFNWFLHDYFKSNISVTYLLLV